MRKLANKLPWLTDVAQVVTITDPANDPDDENTMVLLGKFTLQGAVSLMATVANLAPEAIRAQLTRATYDLLGMRSVKVGVGTNCSQSMSFNPDDHRWQAPYLQPSIALDTKIPNGQEILLQSFQKAKSGSITLLLISGMMDAAKFLSNHKALFLEKIREVVIMGGVKREAGKVILDASGLMTPDSAANNVFDMPSAEYLYRTLQELKITMRILTREAAYAVPFPRSMYDEMALTGHPVGLRLKAMQKASIQNLWIRANMPSDSEIRNLPARCDKKWFCDTFCKGEGKELAGNNEIWDSVKSFILYDPLTLIAAIPRYWNVYFVPCEVMVNGKIHLLVGLSWESHGIKYPDALRGFIHSQMVETLDVFSQYHKITGTYY